jgi:hypothetical protein
MITRDTKGIRNQILLLIELSKETKQKKSGQKIFRSVILSRFMQRRESPQMLSF